MAQKTNEASKRKAGEEKDPEVKIENALGRTELFFEKNWKLITAMVVAVFVVFGGYYAYVGLVKNPRSVKASGEMFVAQQLLAQADYETALNGDGNEAGFLEIAENFGSTPQGRLAAHYAGVCFMKQGEWDQALEYLSKYRPTSGIPNEIVNAQNEGLKGDVYVQKGELAKAVKSFRNAVAASDDMLAAPVYLKKLGMVLEAQGDYKAAAEAYSKIADQYPMSLEARDIDKYIAQAEQKIN